MQREPLTLDAREWREILRRGQTVLAVHIDVSGKMEDVGCLNSYRRAIPFFTRHFPDLNIATFTCTSLLLDPQLTEALPQGSNIVRFLRRYQLHPVPGANDHQTFERVFGEKPSDLSSAPRDNSLRRAILDHLGKGGRWRSGGGMIFPQDIKP